MFQQPGTKGDKKHYPDGIQVWKDNQTQCSLFSLDWVWDPHVDLTLTRNFFHSLLTFLWDSFKDHLVTVPQGMEGYRPLERAACFSFSESFPLKTLQALQTFMWRKCLWSFSNPVFLSCVLRSPRGKWSGQSTELYTSTQLWFGLFYLLGMPIRFKWRENFLVSKKKN